MLTVLSDIVHSSDKWGNLKDNTENKLSEIKNKNSIQQGLDYILGNLSKNQKHAK